MRDGEARTVTFAQGIEQSDRWESGVEERNGTLISFRVDEEVFGAYAYNCLLYTSILLPSSAFSSLACSAPTMPPV